MLREHCEVVPEGNCPIPQQEELGSGEPTLADMYRLCEERFDRMDSYSDRWNRKLDEISNETRVMDKHLTSLEHGARQPRLSHGGRRARKHQDSRAHGGHRYSSTSDTWR